MKARYYFMGALLLFVLSGIPGMFMWYKGAPEIFLKLSLPYWVAISPIPRWIAQIPILEGILEFAKTGQELGIGAFMNDLLEKGKELLQLETVKTATTYTLHPLIALVILIAGMWSMTVGSFRFLLKGLSKVIFK